MFRVIDNEIMSLQVHRLVVMAPQISQSCRAGQCVVLRLDNGYRPIALNITDADPQQGTISLIVRADCEDTQNIVATPAGETIDDITGPFGQAVSAAFIGSVTCVAQGVGAAVIYPVARALAAAGNKVKTILSAATASQLILHSELARLSQVTAVTEDGSLGLQGPMSGVLDALLKNPLESPDAIYAAVPPAVMSTLEIRAKQYGLRVHAIPNPITGSCPGCQVSASFVTSPCVAAQ